MRFATNALLAVAVLALTTGNGWAQESTIDFIVAGPADWNTLTNWDAPGFGNAVPGDGFPQEIASISNAGVATLTSPAAHNVFGLVIGETHDPNRSGGPNAVEEDGTLNISGTGQLRLVDPGGTGAAALRVGANGRGVLNISGGSATADTLSVGGAVDSTLHLSGDGTLAISGNATLQRVTRVEGPNVTFDVEGDLTISGTFVPVLTAASHSEISVFGGNANVGGVLRPEFGGGFTPTLGDTWTLINAASVSGVFTLDASQALDAPRGTLFDVTYDQAGSGDVVMSFTNRLILQVNRRTGVASIENADGGPIDFDAYTISSAAGVLDPGAWMSLEDGGLSDWNEANPTSNALSELNPTDSTELGINSSLPLGTPYAFQPTEIGQAVEDVEFRFGATGGGELAGIVEYVGPHNNMVLTVDPATGDAAITNESLFSAEILGYSIQSVSGSLLPSDGNWESLEDQAVGTWEEANPSANFLNELNPTGSELFNNNDRVLIGSPFDIAGMRDLTVDFLLTSGETLAGIVEYGEIMPIEPGGLNGDTNGDNVVNIDDLNNVRNNFGDTGPSDGTLEGDAFPFDGMVDIDDLNGVRNNFGMMAAPQAVPEPGAWLLLAVGSGLVGLIGRRGRKKDC